MGSVMYVDVTTRKQFALVAGIICSWILISVIIGGTGPSALDSVTWSAYNCSDGSHVFNSDTCSGIWMNQSEWWIQTLPELTTLNRFWALEVSPYTTQPTTDTFANEIHSVVNIYGIDSLDATVWYSLAQNDTHLEAYSCGDDVSLCQGFLLIFEEFINYPYYQVQISFPEASETQTISDVQFKLYFGNATFAKLEISFRTIYLFISIVATIVYLRKMAHIAMAEWTWEQRATALLLVGVCCYNNPFYAIRYGVRGWFVPFISSLFETAWSCILLLFWLLMVDKIRRDELQVDVTHKHLPKLVVVCFYGVLTLVLYAWVSVQDETDPVYGVKVTGVQVLYYITSILWTSIIIWVIVLGVLVIPIVSRKTYLMQRFLFFAVPTCVCIFSLLISIFAGSIGPLNSSSLEVLYFLAMYNCYVYVLAWGYFPQRITSSDTDLTNPTEESPLYYNFGTKN